MIKLLSSEWIKTKRTPIRWLTFFMPVLTALCIVAYLAVRPGLSSIFIFEGFFTLWTTVIIPVGAGLLSGFIVQEEDLAGSFNGCLNTGISRVILYMGKFLLLLFCLMSCTFISTIVLCIGMNITAPGGDTISLFMASALLAVIGTLPILSIHLWISFLWGMGATIGLSMGGILMAALIGANSLGDKIWLFIPWAWPVKLAMFPSIYFPGTSTAVYSGATLQLTIELALTAIGLILFLTGGLVWFQKWEGRA